MSKILVFLLLVFFAVNSFGQFTYPNPPKSTNDATLKGGLRYPHNFTFNGNPVSRMHGAADPDVVVWGDTLWVYTSQDRNMISGVHNSHYDAMDGYHAFSTTDLVNWTDHGEILHSSDVSWAWGKGLLWAPAAARKNGKYYLYYPIADTNKNWKVGVAVGNTPIGPFVDSGKPIDGLSSIDPKVFIDDNGEAFIYNNSAVVAKLKPNMIELAEPVRRVVYGSTEIMNNDTTRFSEGSYMHKKNGIYYYSYTCLGNKTNTSMYAMGTSPYGPFEFKQSMAGWPKGAQDHHSVVEFKGQWYYFYHSAFSDMPQYKESQGRIFGFDRLYYNKDGTIQRVVHTYGPTKILKTNAPHGTIILEPAGGAYAAGTTVKVIVKSDLGYAFNGWNGDLSGSSKTTSIVMDGDKTISASFVPTQTYTLTTNAVRGSVILNPAGGVYNAGDEVTLTPGKVFGYKFSSWGGDLTSSTAPNKISMNSNKRVTVNYSAVTVYKLTSNATNGIIDFNPAGPEYEEGAVVTLNARPDFGYTFNGWSGEVTNKINPMTLTMNSNKTIAANFTYNGTGKIVFATNCGGSAYRSNEGVYYTADVTSGGSTYSITSDIAGSTDDVLYQINRFGKQVKYNIPLPNKTYKVTLLYAEIFHSSTGKRVFDVFIEGVKVSSSLDVYAKVGKNAAYDETHTITLSDGELNIEFVAIADNANISAIKIEDESITSINTLKSTETTIAKNYPNPFQNETTILYHLSEASNVIISVYNNLGQQIKSLVNKYQMAGKYQILWNGTDINGKLVGNGIYFYRLETDNRILVGGKFIINRNI